MIRRCASAVLLAAALHGAAQAEGGLPGSPQAVAAAAPHAAPATPDGGAAFNPFAESADTAMSNASVRRERDGAGTPDMLLTVVVGLAGIAALGWLARIASR
ncbi:hypothetical protein [Variovorax sp. JS1663]|uniref:hypothetical protein n=1 Tax=Variovorax sp. JS1663 TaxID=1851577 RepID=UPI000B3443FA|nr:hypothetical protein [Variovorax sp. JS1663]OUL97983.1 hypothetical protein A8M77_33910 [Variovorax sp. JS1663]